MKHVFVETNFIIDLIRPFPSPDAEKLYSRNNQDVQLYIPWVSITESKRTLNRIIKEDLDFEGTLMQFVVRRFLASAITAPEKEFIDRLAKDVKDARTRAFESVWSEVDRVVGEMIVIEPTKDVIQKTMTIYPIKSLPPFDEMVMGAVLTAAGNLARDGEKEIFFCNLNKNDFDPSNNPELQREYTGLGMQYLPTFKVP